VLQINWQEQWLQVRRLVFRRGGSLSFDAAIDSLAARFRLQVADDRAEPRPGDFWIGCHPRVGWGNADPNLIGWASMVEVPLALGLLRLSELIPEVNHDELTLPDPMLTRMSSTA
jgi:hypothetical protein